MPSPTKHRLYCAGYLERLPNWPKIVLNRQQTHYLKNVLRLKVDSKVEVFDDSQQSFLCHIEAIGRDTIELQFKQKLVAQVCDRSVSLNLAMPYIRSDRFDWAIQKATELGINNITPLNSHFSQAKGKPSKAKMQHWKSVTISACEQCRRNDLPAIHSMLSIDEILTDKSSQLIAFDTTGKDSLASIAEHQSYTLLIGAEGGWSEQELRQFETHAIPTIAIGSLTLRAETAAIVAICLTQHYLKKLVTSVRPR